MAYVRVALHAIDRRRRDDLLMDLCDYRLPGADAQDVVASATRHRVVRAKPADELFAGPRARLLPLLVRGDLFFGFTDDIFHAGPRLERYLWGELHGRRHLRVIRKWQSPHSGRTPVELLKCGPFRYAAAAHCIERQPVAQYCDVLVCSIAAYEATTPATVTTIPSTTQMPHILNPLRLLVVSMFASVSTCACAEIIGLAMQRVVEAQRVSGLDGGSVRPPCANE